jgi:hypothetical protein
MLATARAAISSLILVLPAIAFAQTGPSEPQVISAASTAKISVGNRKLVGHVVATVRVGEDGHVTDVLVTENTAEPSFEPQIVKVLQSARFRPAIDASGKLVEGSIEMKVELRTSTATEPKPVAAKPDPQLTDNEKARIRKMNCRDFIWEWDFIREEADDAVVTEFMPRVTVTMYAAVRTEAGDYVDAKIWKASAKGLKNAVDQCRDTPDAPFFDGVFRTVMDEAVPK